jgi:acetyl-CoA synthetase
LVPEPQLESASLTLDDISEAAPLPVIDELRGRVVEMYVCLKPRIIPSKKIAEKVAMTVETEIGKIARPRNVRIVSDLPKTRSGKIMCRVIASVSNFFDVGDITILATRRQPPPPYPEGSWLTAK